MIWNDLDDAWQHLRARGWTRNRNGQWVKPSPGYNVSELELSAIEYLQKEADDGGIAK